MRKVFQFFRQNLKSVLLIFDKMRKVFQCFLQKAKSVYKMQYRLGNFLLVYSFSSVFPNFWALVVVVFHWFTLNLSSILIIKMKLKKIINYRKRSQNQAIFIYKNI